MATMKPKPKITRLGDPSNPYTKKKVTAAQARASAKATGNDKPKPKPKAATKRNASNKATGEGFVGRQTKARMDRKIAESGG